MPDREKVIKGLAHCTRPTEYGKGGNRCMDCPYTEAIGFNQFKCNGQQMMKDALAMLKEQDEQVKQWTKEIADNQLAHAPDELDRENWDYKKGIWDGLQIAWNIISEGR